MKQFGIFLISVFALLSCNESASTSKSKPTFLSLISPYYKDTSFKELLVYPDTGYMTIKYYFAGKQLDSSVFSKVGENITDGLDWSLGYYGVYKFNMDNDLIGFITRVPGEYESSTIELWVFDKKSDAFVNKLFLADLFGDAGEMQITNSYLFFDKMNSLNSAYSVYWSYDNSIEEEGDSTLDEAWDYGWLKFEGQSFDTISVDSSRIVSKFKSKFDKMP